MLKSRSLMVTSNDPNVMVISIAVAQAVAGKTRCPNQRDVGKSHASTAWKLTILPVTGIGPGHRTAVGDVGVERTDVGFGSTD